MIQDEKERLFLEQLRKEASDVKACFTNFSFQALALSSAVLALMFGAMEKFPYATLASVPVIILLMIVCRIGIFKYSTANRHYGYELYLGRIADLYGSNPQNELYQRLRSIRWEVALRAWRVVQTTVFRKIYKTPENNWLAAKLNRMQIFNWINHFRPGLYRFTKDTKKMIKDYLNQNRSGGYPWFLPSLLTKARIADTKIVTSHYHAGTYLKNLFGILIVMQYLQLAPLTIITWNKIQQAKDSPSWSWLIVLVVLFILILFRHSRVKRRRTILENELLSIHSCSIMWQAVIIAHLLALKKTNYTLIHYTEELTAIAQEMATNVYNIHEWIDKKMKALG